MSGVVASLPTKTKGARASVHLKLTRRERDTAKPASDVGRVLPATRAACEPEGENAERPCPYVTCRHHLYLDATEGGAIQLNFPEREVEDIPETCSIDAGARGTLSLKAVGRRMNLTRQRVEQMEAKALAYLQKDKRVRRLHDELGSLSGVRWFAESEEEARLDARRRAARHVPPAPSPGALSLAEAVERLNGHPIADVSRTP